MIELLCVIAIIGILAGLLLGPAGRALANARDAEWANKAYQRLERVVSSLQAHYQATTVTRPLGVRELFDRGIIDGEECGFLLDRRVAFTPFSSADPDELVVIQVKIPKSFLTDQTIERVLKVRITNPDKNENKGKS